MNGLKSLGKSMGKIFEEEMITSTLMTLFQIFYKIILKMTGYRQKCHRSRQQFIEELM